MRYQDIEKGVVLGFFLYEQTFTIVRLLLIGDIPCDVINLQPYASVEHVVTLRDELPLFLDSFSTFPVMGSRNFPRPKCLIAGCWFSGQCQKCQRHPKLTSGPSCTHTQILHDFATYLYPNLAEFISSHIFIIKQLLELNRRLPLMVSPLSKLAKPSNSMILELEQCLQLRCLYGCVS